jgi:hypothetical protein
MTASDIRQRLRRWHDDAELIMALLDAHDRIASAQHDEAKRLFKKLREEFREAAASLSRQDAEQFGRSSVRADTTPNTKWYSALEAESQAMDYCQDGLIWSITGYRRSPPKPS